MENNLKRKKDNKSNIANIADKVSSRPIIEYLYLIYVSGYDGYSTTMYKIPYTDERKQLFSMANGIHYQLLENTYMQRAAYNTVMIGLGFFTKHDLAECEKIYDPAVAESEYLKFETSFGETTNVKGIYWINSCNLIG